MQPGHYWFFNIPKKSPLKSTYPKKYLPNFVPKKISESKIWNPKKSFYHPHSLKILSTPLPPRWGLCMGDGPLMLQVNWPVVDTILQYSNRCEDQGYRETYWEPCQCLSRRTNQDVYLEANNKGFRKVKRSYNFFTNPVSRLEQTKSSHSSSVAYNIIYICKKKNKVASKFSKSYFLPNIFIYWFAERKENRYITSPSSKECTQCMGMCDCMESRFQPIRVQWLF